MFIAVKANQPLFLTRVLYGQVEAVVKRRLQYRVLSAVSTWKINGDKVEAVVNCQGLRVVRPQKRFIWMIQ